MTRERCPSLATLGEFGLIKRIADGVNSGNGVITGIGDDAAVTSPSPGMALLTTTDLLLEDVHFRLDWHDPCRLGRKSIAVNLSDIAAMGGIPRWALLSLAIPRHFQTEFLDSFMEGFLSMAAEHDVTLIGGDTSAAKNALLISVTVIGEQRPEHVVKRSDARGGDDIWVTGSLGDAALALLLLEGDIQTLSQGDGGDEAVKHLTSRLLDPTPRVAVGRVLAESGLISALCDISDGIAADFGHIAELSETGGIIMLDSLPLSDAFRSVSSSLPEFPLHLALNGGEDYELLFTSPPANREKITEIMKKCGIAATPVGIVTDIPGVKVIERDGSEFVTEKSGFNHFSNNNQKQETI